MAPDILDEICRLRRDGRKAVLATIVQVHGAIPSFETTKMLVRDDGSILGSLGDGFIEADVWTAAQDVFIEEKSRVMQFDLTDDSLSEDGPIQGGKLEIFIEAILPIPEMLIFGSDEIAIETSKIALIAGFRTTIVDCSGKDAFKDLPEGVAVYSETLDTAFQVFAPTDNTYVVIPAPNDRVLEWVTKTNARYVGTIDKDRGVQTISNRRLENGPGEPRNRLQSGIDIGAIFPAEIAVGLVAEAIQSRRVGVKHPPRTWLHAKAR